MERLNFQQLNKIMISLIASIGKNNEIGKNGDLVWHIKEDMKFFKNTTINHIVVMGFNTYKSLPGPLKDREMIVLSKHNNIDGIKIIRNYKEIVDKYKDSEIEVFKDINNKNRMFMIKV